MRCEPLRTSRHLLPPPPFRPLDGMAKVWQAASAEEVAQWRKEEHAAAESVVGAAIIKQWSSQWPADLPKPWSPTLQPTCHEFGADLSAEERNALVAFLKTL